MNVREEDRGETRIECLESLIESLIDVKEARYFLAWKNQIGRTPDDQIFQQSGFL